MRLIIVSGLSGSGKSTALHTLEDLDFYCIDNLPVGMLPELVRHLRDTPDPERADTAIGIDARNHAGDLEAFTTLTEKLREDGVQVETWFLRADNAALLKRYSETRRKHPLSMEGLSLADAIQREREILDPVASRADLYFDTTRTNIHQLRDQIRAHLNSDGDQGFLLLFQSFGYKNGVPGDADFVFDVRCLRNPHWIPELRPLTGRDEAVADFLESDTLTQELTRELTDFLEQWLPRFEADNRSYMNVSIGCTGGQHRSVYMVEKLAAHFAESYLQTTTRHREIP